MRVYSVEAFLRHECVFAAVELVVCVDFEGVQCACADCFVVRGAVVDDLVAQGFEFGVVEGSCGGIVGVCDLGLPFAPLHLDVEDGRFGGLGGLRLRHLGGFLG